jgi:hypothetical protein
MTIESRTGLQPSRQASFLPLLIIEWCLSSCVTLILPTCKYTRKLLKNRKTRDGLSDCNKSWFGFCNPTLQQGFCFSGWKSNGEQPVSECSGLNCWVQRTNMKLCRVFLSLKFITTFLKKNGKCTVNKQYFEFSTAISIQCLCAHCSRSSGCNNEVK